MLHETVYNDGEIGRPWQTGQQGNETTVPLMEWPPYSKTIVNGIKYSGQHNILGAGMYIGANLDTLPGEENRLFALCGAVGASDPEKVVGVWSFPISITEVDNYPIRDDGTVNPDYDPNDAEQIITAKWSTPTGITVTRTSRQFSYPDYDDFIIYEYTLEYTGDTDGNLATVEMDEPLHDVMVCFNYGFAPSMYGFQRWYNEWKYDGGIYRGDLRGYFDASLWLKFNLDNYVNKTQKIMAKPEPDPQLFKEFAETGKNGGGLDSPQAPGWMVMYYDTTKLANVVPEALQDTAAARGIYNQSEAASDGRIRSSTVLAAEYDPSVNYPVAKNENGDYVWYYELTRNYHIKQPWDNKVSTGNVRSQKLMYQKDPFNPNTRWSGVYGPNSTTWPEPPSPSDRWIGRAAFNYRQTSDAGMQLMTFGPYTMNKGDKIEFSLAEVIGYGGQPGKRVEGGDAITQWSQIPNWNRPVIINGDTMTTKYIDDYGYPDYVNSDVVTVQDVAKKALEAYLGHPATLPAWPADYPKDGVYQIPNPPPPAPAIVVDNTSSAKIKLHWTNAPETFQQQQGNANIVKYIIYRSVAGMGPWHVVDSVAVGTDDNGTYSMLDEDQSFKVGDTRYYAVTSVDANGVESGKTNITNWRKDVHSVAKMGKVYVVPNPFIEKSGFAGAPEESIAFYGLPTKCTIRIYSYAGQLVDKIEHDEAVYSHNKNLVTINHQELASGIYFYIVTTPDGDRADGKFVILK